MTALVANARSLHRPGSRKTVAEIVASLSGATTPPTLKNMHFPLSRLTARILADAVNELDTATLASVTAGNAETYNLSDGQTLTVKVDGGGVQTATFNTGDFSNIALATAAEVAAVMETDIPGAASTDAAGSPKIESDSQGVGASIEVTGGTANGALGFSTTIVTPAQDVVTVKQMHDPWDKRFVDRLAAVDI